MAVSNPVRAFSYLVTDIGELAYCGYHPWDGVIGYAKKLG